MRVAPSLGPESPHVARNELQRPPSRPTASPVLDRHESSSPAGALQLLRQLGQDARSLVLSSAVEKLSATMQLLALDASSGMDSNAAQAAYEQGQQARVGVRQADHRMQDHLARLARETHKRQVQVKERIDAALNASFWDKLVDVFKTVAAFAAAVGAAFSGGTLAIVSASLIASSAVVAQASDSEIAQGFTIGLSIAGAGFGLAGALRATETAVAELDKPIALLASSCKLIAGAAELGGAVSTGVGSYFAGQELQAQAQLTLIEGRSKQLLAQLEDDREGVEGLLQTVHQAGLRSLRILDVSHITAAAALR